MTELTGGIIGMAAIGLHAYAVLLLARLSLRTGIAAYRVEMRIWRRRLSKNGRAAAAT